MHDSLHITFVPIARPTFDMPLATAVTERVRARLITAGFELSGPDKMVADLATAQRIATEIAANPPDLLLILQSTFADSTMIVTLAQAVTAPLVIWAIPEAPTGGRLRLNSLCGVNLGGHALRLRRRHYTPLYAPADDAAALEKIRVLAQAGRVYGRLQQTQLGLIGQHPDGMDTCHLDAPLLKAQLGVGVKQFELDTVFERMPTVSASQLDGLAADLRPYVPNIDELDSTPLRGTLRAYVVLSELAQAANLDGLAIRCWPEFFEKMNCSACGAMSLLNDQQLPASCEADVNGTITQLILQWLSGKPTFDTDLVSVDVEANTAVLWHCGKAPLSMANRERPVNGGIHSNRKVPLVMEFSLKPGRVTLARLSRASGQLRLVIGSGEMLDAPQSFSGTSGVFRFDNPVSEVLETILGEGLEHHVALTYGDYVPALYALADLLSIPTLAL